MTILLVDDHMGTRVTLSIALRNEGFEVDVAQSASEALGKVKNKSYDWVISDIVMPRMGGLKLAKKVKSLRPECKIVLISVEECPHQADGIGIAGFFKKPVDIDGLANLLGEK